MAAADHLDMLTSMFPSIERPVIDSVFESSGHNVEAAVEMLLRIATPETEPGGSVHEPGATARGDPPQVLHAQGEEAPASCSAPGARQRQLEEDEALARQLQQHLMWEDELAQRQAGQLLLWQGQHGVQQLPHPGGLEGFAGPHGASVSAQYGLATVQQPGHRSGSSSWATASASPADTSEQGLGISTGLSSIGSAVYSAGAATVDTASNLVSSLWGWATAEPAQPSPRPLRPHESRGSADAPSAGETLQAADEDVTQVVDHGGVDHTESGSLGEVRRRPRRTQLAD